MTKILEWIFRGPKITGSMRQVITAHAITYTGTGTNTREYIGAHVLLHVYMVNRRIAPTTIKSFYVFAKIGGKWVKAQLLSIPEGFKLSECPYIDFSRSVLADKAGLELLEYGKGVSGWLRVMFKGIQRDDVLKVDYRIDAVDAFDHTHKIILKYKEGRIGDLDYFPGAGMTPY